MAKGRKTGGRVKGTPNKRTVAKTELVEQYRSEGITPLEVMLGAMREAWDAGDKPGAAAIAKDAAPYMHPRLGQNHTTIAGDEDRPLQYGVLTAIERDAGIVAALAPPDDDTADSYH